MTQYKTVIVPTSYDSTNLSAEAITKAITEEAKDGWELAVAQEMETGKNQGFFANLFGGKQTKKNTLLVFKKEEKKPEPKPAKDFDYDKFEEIVAKGMDYNKFASVFKKVVEETEITLSKKSFAGLKLTVPTPALPMNNGEPAALPLNVNFGGDNAKAADGAKDDKKADAAEDNNLAIAKVVYEIFGKNTGKGISFEDIKKECEGKIPEGSTDDEILTVVNEFVNHEIVKKENDLYVF